jgi:hypothetical protein
MLCISVLAAPKAFAVVLDVKKTFHAVGDGITDDTEAITEALQSASYIPGTGLYFAPGTYRFEKTMSVLQARLIGDPNGQSSLLSATPAASFNVLVGTQQQPASFEELNFVAEKGVKATVITGNNSLTVHNCRFTGVNAIHVQNTSGNNNDYEIHNNVVTNPPEVAFLLENCGRGSIENNSINAATPGVRAIAAASCRDLSVRTNRIAVQGLAFNLTGCTNGALVANTLVGGTYAGSNNNTVGLVNNAFTSPVATAIVEQSSTSISVEGNSFAGAVQNSIELDGVKGANVRFNKCKNCNIGVKILDGSTIEISTNVVDNCSLQGILVSNAVGVDIDGNGLTNCGLSLELATPDPPRRHSRGQSDRPDKNPI